MALKNYEIVLVFSLSKGEEAAQALKTKFTDLISKHGTLGEVEEAQAGLSDQLRDRGLLCDRAVQQ